MRLEPLMEDHVTGANAKSTMVACLLIAPDRTIEA
jgi:hypothetical protein